MARRSRCQPRSSALGVAPNIICIGYLGRVVEHELRRVEERASWPTPPRRARRVEEELDAIVFGVTKVDDFCHAMIDQLIDFRAVRLRLLMYFQFVQFVEVFDLHCEVVHA